MIQGNKENLRLKPQKAHRPALKCLRDKSEKEGKKKTPTDNALLHNVHPPPFTLIINQCQMHCIINIL